MSLSNFVLVEALQLEPGGGFTCLTGETGAGKSILLDAIGVALGGKPERRFIRAGADQAVVSAAFAPHEGSPVWALLSEHGVEAAPDDPLILKRVIPAQGPARGFVNDQPASATFLGALGAHLVEIHGQHAAAGLLRPAAHRDMLDAFGGLAEQVAACGSAWRLYQERLAARAALDAAASASREERDWLVDAVEELTALAPETGEAARLSARRAQGMQSERLNEAAGEAAATLANDQVESALVRAAKALDRVERLVEVDGPLHNSVSSAVGAVERALIETREAEARIGDILALAEHDEAALEAAETRLFALKAAARKHRVAPDELPAVLAKLTRDLEACELNMAELTRARSAEEDAKAAWRAHSAALTEQRAAAAARFEAAVASEFGPLKLDRARLRVRFTPSPLEEAGPKGAEAASFEIETAPGAGFGPLHRIASGGELARVSLAAKCAMAGGDAGKTLIFDEADQGVGGAVAAAIGERLARLGRDRQVFAVTHSPQVAAAASAQWRIEKTPRRGGFGQTRARVLDEAARREEIARMLSGASVTQEARAAAERLLEEA
ncbi:MAG: DNA repair protein RecN [Pseudomonadota bacterium]